MSDYKLAVSLFGETLETLRSRVSSARAFDPELIELRLDYLRDLDYAQVKAVGNLLRGNEILTIRSRAEGGKYKQRLSERERISLVREAIEKLEPAFVDVEIRTLEKNPELYLVIQRSHTQLIASFHDFAGKTSPMDLKRIISIVPQKAKNLFAIKIVREARSLEDNLRVLRLYDSSIDSNLPKKLNAFCTGKLGICSRVLSLFLGAPFAYTSLPGEPLAAGQLDIDTMRKVLGAKRK